MTRRTSTDEHTSVRLIPRRIVAAMAMSVAAACGGGDEGGTVDSPQAGSGGAPAAAPAAPPGAAPAGPAGPLTEGNITPSMVALGDSIFEGQAAGGICFTCHSSEGEGGPIGPNLADEEWLNGDGSLDFIATTIRNGVPQPKQFPAPMPAFGQSFNEEQIRALAAYVYSLSHPNVGGAGH